MGKYTTWNAGLVDPIVHLFQLTALLTNTGTLLSARFTPTALVMFVLSIWDFFVIKVQHFYPMLSYL